VADSQCALDAANNAANNTASHSARYAANRPEYAMPSALASLGAMVHTFRNALSLGYSRR
jgi:hypothetical protein